MMNGRISVERWPTEIPLFVLVALSAALIWLFLVISIFGVLYALFLAVFFFVSQLAFIAQIRGSAVRLGPDQFPELHKRVVELSRAMDLDPPAAYVMQAGGALNAFATRFLRRNLIVLFSDLLEACEDDPGARDMIIAHELAHVRCGHLKWWWFILPGYFVPFLGGALSRAREYTCDRIGAQGAGSRQSAVKGLAILAAGPKLVRDVNLRAFVGQQSDLNTGFMTLGQWLGSHPPLSNRIAVLDSSLVTGRFHPTRGRLMAVLILASIGAVGIGAVAVAATFGSGLMEALDEASASGAFSPDAYEYEPFEPPDPAEGTAAARVDFAALTGFIDETWGADYAPATMADVQRAWAAAREDPFPTDPFNGYWYGYERLGSSYRMWSVGPDGLGGTRDDLGSDEGG